ncbi:DnaJ-domain-containing protein [Fomitiporia mediterranea MF3/22]|uniref:DnaJ-domain-containing protein n=1 Tax=Fomitiporia mediterranea (strain MF3/22) TaxID=694068 RepID=UPI000440889D|nr:DnaJ-domain-containing protein [Fomitiporia mediterranea MF3/22]EJD05886.1 DnaJ-domain-containing protein [Fomitiporia mediterranea MF3/22]
MDQEDPITQFFPGQEDVDLYAVLSLESSATPDAIKKAYRRLALVHHPDKHVNSSEEAHADASVKFQQVGFAYAVLSDEKRRARYDKTGRTDEGFELQAGEDGWDAYFSDLFDTVTKGKLDELKKEYQGMCSAEEVEDIKRAYLETDSTIGEIMNHIPHSTFDDEARFIVLITQLIKDGELPVSKAWEKSVKDEKAKLVRKKQGEKEAAEAEELAKELGVWDEFYGSGKAGPRKTKGKSASKDADANGADDDTNILQALILKKKKNMDGFFDNLAAKYAEPEPKGKGKKGKKRGNDEDDASTGKKSKAAPPEIDDEEFEKLQQKLFGGKQNGSEQEATGKRRKVSARGGRGKAAK